MTVLAEHLFRLRRFEGSNVDVVQRVVRGKGWVVVVVFFSASSPVIVVDLDIDALQDAAFCCGRGTNGVVRGVAGRDEHASARFADGRNCGSRANHFHLLKLGKVHRLFGVATLEPHRPVGHRPSSSW